MATKTQLAERIAQLEQPNGEPEVTALLIATLVDGHTKPALEARLATAQAKALTPPPDVPTGAQETPQAAPGAQEPAQTAPGAPGEQPGTDVAPVNPMHAVAEAHAAASSLPTLSEWAHMENVAKFIARSKLAPRHLQGKPDDVQMILLVARDLGISPTRAMQKVAVIEGQVAMTAELMVAVVLRDGHRIWPDPNNDATKATAYGQRREYDGGWGPVMEATFTLDDAVAAGLCAIKDGRAYARSSNNKKLPWETYTADLLWARAVSRLVRRGFADSGNGVTYVPEELGYIEMDDDHDTPNRHADRAAAEEAAEVSLAQQRTEIARRISELPDDDRKQVAEEWRRRNLPRTAELRPAAIRTALNLLEAAEQRVATRDAAATADIPEAELVDDNAGDGDGDDPPRCTICEGALDDDHHTSPWAEGFAHDGCIVAETDGKEGAAPAVDPDTVVAEATLVDGAAAECAAGDGGETPDRPFVFHEGATYHADCAPFL